MQREAHVRAAIVDGQGLTVVPEHAHRAPPGLAGQAARGLQLSDGSYDDPISHGDPPRCDGYLSAAG